MYNTFYNGPGGIWEKEGNTGTIAAYNYFYYIGAGGVYGSAEYCSALMGWDDTEGMPNTGPAGYLTYQIHHNIIDTCVSPRKNQDTAPGSLQSTSAWNNTVYDKNSGAWPGWMMGSHGGADTEFYNNVYVTNNPNSDGSNAAQSGKLNINSSNFSQVDYNCYHSANGTTTAMWGVATTNYSSAQFSSYQSAVQGIVAGSESHSLSADPEFTVGTLNVVSGGGPAQFKLASGSPCVGTGKGGVNMGAWDGTVTQIGCSFAPNGVASASPVPDPPALTVS